MYFSCLKMVSKLCAQFLKRYTKKICMILLDDLRDIHRLKLLHATSPGKCFIWYCILFFIMAGSYTYIFLSKDNLKKQLFVVSNLIIATIFLSANHNAPILVVHSDSLMSHVIRFQSLPSSIYG